MKKFLSSLILGLTLMLGGGMAMAQTAPAAPTAAVAEAKAPAAAEAAAPAAAPVPNKGDTAWMTVATLLVILMTLPGLALFYGGLVRSKNMLSVLMQVFMVSIADVCAVGHLRVQRGLHRGFAILRWI